MRLVGIAIALLGIIGLALIAPAPAGAQSPPAIPTAGWSATNIEASPSAALWYNYRFGLQFDLTTPSLSYEVCLGVELEVYDALTAGGSVGKTTRNIRIPPSTTSLTGQSTFPPRMRRTNPRSYADGRTHNEYAELNLNAFHPQTPGDCDSGAIGTRVAVFTSSPRIHITYDVFNPTEAIYTQAAAPPDPAVGENAIIVATLTNPSAGPGGYCYRVELLETVQGQQSPTVLAGNAGWYAVNNGSTTSWNWTVNKSTLTVVTYQANLWKTNELIDYNGTCESAYPLNETTQMNAPSPATFDVTWRAIAPTTSNELSVNVSAPFPTVSTSSDIISTFENTSPQTTYYCYKVVIRERGVDLYQSPYYVVQGGVTQTGGTGTGEIADLVYSVNEPDVTSRSFQIRLWRSADQVEATGSPPTIPTTCSFNELNAAEAVSAGIGTVTISWRIGPGTLSPDDGECPMCFLEYQPTLTSPPIVEETATPGTYLITLDWTPILPAATGIERTEYEIVIEPDGIPINSGETEANGGTPTISRDDDGATAVISYVANDIGTPRRQIFIRAKWYTVSGGYPFPRASGQVEVVQGNQYIYSGWGKYYIFLTRLTPYVAPATPTPKPGAVAMHERGVRPQARAAADGAVKDVARLFINVFSLYEYEPGRTPFQNAAAYEAMLVEWQSYLWAAFALVVTMFVAVPVTIAAKTFTAMVAAISALVFTLMWFFGGLAFGGFSVPFATIPVALVAGAGGIYWWTNR